MPTIYELRQMQSLPLEAKIIKSQQRIREWYEHWDGQVYVSFSGGKDSTVLLHLVRKIYPDVPAVFVNTGLEFPEITQFVKTIDNVVWLRPKHNFKWVVEKYGYPVVSKECSQAIYELRNYNIKPERRDRLLHGPNETCKGSQRIADKWQFLLNAPFKISDRCCRVIKKEPIKHYEKTTGRKMITGEMAADSRARKFVYLQTGCNAFDLKRPKSTPIGFWTENDIWDYIHGFNIPYASIYDLGEERTGCFACMFGIHLDKVNRFQRMEKTHPRLHKYCIEKLGLGEVLDYMGIDYHWRDIPVQLDLFKYDIS